MEVSPGRTATDVAEPVPTRTFVELAAEPDAERFIETILPGVHSAGIPFDDWLYGGPDEARAALRETLRRASSELFIGRATLCVVDGVVVGGIIALGGAALATCRVADGIASLKRTSGERRSTIAKRIDEARSLFPAVQADEFYLSRIWVSPGTRGTGHGIALVREYLASGRRRGFTRYRADICSTNTGVLRLAEFFKFQQLGSHVSEEAGMAYVSILRDDGDEESVPDRTTT